MKTITKQELKGWQESKKAHFLLDVRELWEHEHYNIGGIHIPLGELMSRKEEIDNTLPIVIYCEKGIRSAIAIQRLEALGFTDMYNVDGGMSKWKIEQP